MTTGRERIGFAESCALSRIAIQQCKEGTMYKPQQYQQQLLLPYPRMSFSCSPLLLQRGRRRTDRSPLCALHTGFSSSELVQFQLLLSEQQQQQSAITTVPSFEPQLNVPVFGVFLLIVVVFGLLQYRMAAVGIATKERMDALERLRITKSLELENKVSSEQQVQEATDAYRASLERVKRSRQIIPGDGSSVRVRIPIPPGSEAREQQRIHLAAAQQFLNLNATAAMALLDLTTEEQEEIQKGNAAAGTDPRRPQQQQQQQTPMIPEWVLVALLILAASQVFFVMLFAMDYTTAQQVLSDVPLLE